MRGEDDLKKLFELVCYGSPPHARGRRPHVNPSRVVPGITPACAGKTASLGKRIAHRSDHPRMRGEDHPLWIKAIMCTGSPPHARGRLQEIRPDSKWFRITPACAGKTFGLGGGLVPPWDHPRMRGEDATYRQKMSLLAGSPPHARGRRSQSRKGSRASGITPACAGKTTPAATTSPKPRDHPRMRGEDSESSQSSPIPAGSPPHARGRLSTLRTPRRSCRITPACAGKTRATPSRRRRAQDHPRMRGEDARDLRGRR